MSWADSVGSERDDELDDERLHPSATHVKLEESESDTSSEDLVGSDPDESNFSMRNPFQSGSPLPVSEKVYRPRRVSLSYFSSKSGWIDIGTVGACHGELGGSTGYGEEIEAFDCCAYKK